MGVPLPSVGSGASMFGASGYLLQMPDGSIVNFAMTSKIRQDGKTLVVQYPNGISDTFAYSSTTVAAAALIGIADGMVAQLGILSLRSITPSSGPNSTTTNAVLIGTGFQYDLVSGTWSAGVTVDVNPCTVTYVNSNTLLLQFTSPVAGTYDVTYTPLVGAAVVLSQAWTSV